MTALFYFAMTLFVVVCGILILLILIQKGRGGGLASAFGGAGGQTAFGSKTGDVLTWATSVVFAVFVILAVCLNLISNRIDSTRNRGAVIPVVANRPVLPGSPDSSLPQAPAGEPGVVHQPPANTSAGPTTSMGSPVMTAPVMTAPATSVGTTTAPSVNAPLSAPTTLPAMGNHAPMTTLPTTLR